MSERPARIRGTEYDATTGALTVRYITGTYIYSGVPPALGDTIQRAHEKTDLSVVIDRLIEGKFKSERVGT